MGNKRHLFKLVGVTEHKIIEVSKWATVEEALTARYLAQRENEECLASGEQKEYITYQIIVEY